MNNKENSPFTPGNPVPIELFVGRTNQINEILRYVKQTSFGKQENVFLAGERGIGKSSLAAFLRYWVINKENFLGIHVFSGGVSTLEELVRRIFDQLLKEVKEQTWFEDISKFFGNYIKEVGLFGISVSFNPPEKDLKKLVRNFPKVLENIIKKLKDKKKGLFIALDDINGLSTTPDFANWYKSFVDEVATHYTYFPLFIMPIGLPEVRDALSEHQPSLMRIFRVVDINKLFDKEVETFFEEAFKNVMKVKPEATEVMVKFSSGLPLLMHEIGDAIFWKDEDGIISEKDALGGILDAAERIGRKYLDPKVYRAIRSERYRSILRKLERAPISRNFKRREIEEKLNESEKRVFNNFLIKMRDLGIIISDIEKGRGNYSFVNEIYPIYIWMESEKFRKI